MSPTGAEWPAGQALHTRPTGRRSVAVPSIAFKPRSHKARGSEHLRLSDGCPGEGAYCLGKASVVSLALTRCIGRHGLEDFAGENYIHGRTPPIFGGYSS